MSRPAGTVVALVGLLSLYAVSQPAGDAPADKMVPVAETESVRQTEAEAFAAAKASGRRVEIGAFRGESREVYANPDGTTTALEHVQPVRVVREGRWVPVDPTLVRGSDGSIRPKAAAIGLRLSGGGETPLVHVDRAGRTMTLDWPGSLPSPKLEGDRATYSEVLPGVDLVVNVGVTGFSHVLVIKTAEAAQRPELAAIDFELATNGLTLRNEEAGLRAVDAATGATVLEAATPMMWDSGGATAAAADKASRAADPAPAPAVEVAPASAKRARMGVELSADKLTLLPDRAMLTNASTRWPVYIDPIWQDTRVSGWAMVASGYPNERYWKFSGTEGVGECPVSSGQCYGTGVKRIFYALPTPYSGRTILSASLLVTMTHTYDGSAKKVALYRAGSGINSGTTWNNQPALSSHQQTISPTATRSSCTSTNQNVEFNVLGAVRDAAAKNWSTTTFGLRAENESDHTAWKRFCGNAILSVNYNRAPSTPKQSELTMNPGGSCIYGANRPYTDRPPVLYAILRDPDHAVSANEQLRAEFKVYWTPAGGSTITRTFMSGKKASGSRFSYDTAGLGLPQNVVIAWEVRAHDDKAAGPWSSQGDQTRCEFIYDSTKPPAPDIDSPEFAPLDGDDTAPGCVDDDSWRGSIGTYGTFIFRSTGTDVVRYEYGFDTDPSPNNLLTPTTPGGPVSVTWLADRDGPRSVSVKAFDRAGNSSPIATCNVNIAMRLAAGEWGLGEPAQSGSAADARGQHPATVGSGAIQGVAGPGCQDTGDSCQVDKAVRLSGATDSFLTTESAGLVDTSRGFAVAAWVLLRDDNRDQVAVSQNGTGEPGFTLGFDGATKKWEFEIPTMDVNSLGTWSVRSTKTATKGAWTHLVGVYDPVQSTLQLYVNGAAQPTAQRRSNWKSRGAVQIGRSLTKSGYARHWSGDLADVAVFDRMVMPHEVDALAQLRPLRVGYWPLDEVSQNRSPEYRGQDGQELVIEGGVQLYAPDREEDPLIEEALVGAGHLQFNGVDGSARTESPVDIGDGSFTVSLRVRLSAPECGRDMTAISQADSRNSKFLIRCAAANRWELVMPADPTDGSATTTVFSAELFSAEQAGQHLALVYDAFAKEVTLYVQGEVAVTARAPHPGTWAATGGLQLGRALVRGGYQEYFAGVIDDVRVYRGVADARTVQLLKQTDPRPDL